MSADGTPPTATTKMVALATLKESRWQPAGRSERNLDGLIVSIANHGIIGALLVRLLPDGTPELISGHRTRAAALKVGLEEGPADIRENVGDDEAQELFFVSNGHRDDMTPGEEAELFGSMIKAGWTADRIADRMGKSLPTVNKRLVLLRLVPSARAALDDEKVLLGVAEQLALLSAADQAKAIVQLKTDEEPVGRRLGLRILQAYQRSLSDVPWGLGDAELLPSAGACTTCPKRTAAQLVLIGEDTGDGDRCLDAKCYDAKRKAHEEEIREVAEEDHRDTKPAKSDPQPPGPVTHIEPPAPPPDFERLANQAARERALEEIAAAAGRKKKIGLDALKGLAVLMVHGASEEVMNQAFSARVGAVALGMDARETLAKWARNAEKEAELYSLMIEITVADAEAGAMPDEEGGVLELACRQFAVDLDELRAEELKRLKKEHAKSAKEDNPAPSERVGSTSRERAGDEIEAKCAVCGCTDWKPCTSSDGNGDAACVWVDEREDLCSSCAPLLDLIEAKLSEKPRQEKEIATEVLRDMAPADGDAIRVKEAIGALIERERAALFIDGSGNGSRKLALYTKKKVAPPPPAPERSEVEKAARSKLTKSEVHLLVKVPTGKRGKPPIKKLCEVDAPAANVEPVNTVGAETCVGCRTAWATIEAARKEAGL